MISILFILFLIPKIALADIFMKPINQQELDQALLKDYQNFYYRGSYDYNPYALSESAYLLDKSSISPGVSRFNFHKSLGNIIKREEFQGAELNSYMNQIANSSLMVWQYSSPSTADLYKHLYTNSYLRLSDRYKQFESLEREIDDPITKLRKQAILGCIKNKDSWGNLDDMDQVFQDCFDGIEANSLNKTPLDSLYDPSNGNYKISGTVNLTFKVLERVKTKMEDMETIKNILPKILISNNSVSIQGPKLKSRELIAEYREEFLRYLNELVEDFQNKKELNMSLLSKLSVFGMPLTEGQIKNISILDETVAYLAMNKVASELAYLKTIDQFIQASYILDRAMTHPAIESGYKTLLKSDVDFVLKEITVLKDEKERLSQYAQTMRSILTEADKRRLKAIAFISDEANSKKEERVFNLNP